MNVNYNKYLDMLMQNHPLDTDSENSQYGGTKKDGSVPFGGFPPIYFCSRDLQIYNEENKNREYSTHKTAISIKDIMKKRRKIELG